MFKLYEEIIKLLRANGVSYNEITHEPVYTSEQAANIRGMDLHSGAKSLLLKTDKEFVMAVLPGDQKLNSKKVKAYFKTKSLRFAKPDEVKEIMGCEIGAVYPFGNLVNINMVVDPSLGDNEHVFFNPGIHSRSIKLKWEDYLKVAHPALLEIS